MPLLLPLLDPMVDAFIVLGIIVTIAYFGRAILSAVKIITGDLPLVGWFIDKTITSVIHTISHWMGQALHAAVSGGQSVDAWLGAALHRTAAGIGAFVGMAKELVSFAHAVTSAVANLATPEEIHRLARDLHNAVTRALHEVHAVERTAIHDARASVASIAHGVYPRLRTLEHEAEHVLPREIKNLRARVKALEDGAVATFDWIVAHPAAAVTTAFAGAVAIALSALGLGYVRCENNKALGRTMCGLEGNLLQDLLGGLFAAGLVLEFRELVKVAQTVERDVAVGVKDLMNV